MKTTVTERIPLRPLVPAPSPVTGDAPVADARVAETPLAPHPPLGRYYATPDAKRKFVGAIFDQTAGEYDRIERMMAFGSGPWYRRQALRRAGLAPGMKCLDVAVGTGLVGREAVGIVGAGGEVVGLDPSTGMLA